MRGAPPERGGKKKTVQSAENKGHPTGRPRRIIRDYQCTTWMGRVQCPIKSVGIGEKKMVWITQVPPSRCLRVRPERGRRPQPSEANECEHPTFNIQH